MDAILKYTSLGLILATAATALASNLWLGELSTHFALQYALCALALCIGYGLTRKFTLMAGSALVLLFHLLALAPPSSPAQTLPAAEAHAVTLLQFNVFIRNTRLEEIVRWLNEQRDTTDIILLQEATPALAEALGDLSRLTYPHQARHPQANAYGNILLSRYPLRASKNIPLADGTNHYLYAEIEIAPHTLLHLYALHTASPGSPHALQLRNQQLAEIARIIKADPHPYKLLAGDLNITPYSPYFPQLIADSGLYDPLRGWWPLGTWPAPFPSAALRIPIDHLLTSLSLQVLEKDTGNGLGSDHLPVLSRIAFPAPAIVSAQ